MTDRLTLGYRTATTATASPVGPGGTEVRGHEFHYSTVEPAGEALRLSSRWGQRGDGFASPSLLATYLHVHPGGDPTPVAAFAGACARVAGVGVASAG
jgi:cobyrinic acid a,c-diamide synthase